MAWLEWLGSLPPAELLRRSATLYLLVNATHILGVGLLVGSILPLDLRLIGVLRQAPIAVLAPFLIRVAAAGLSLAIATGLLLFSVKPTDYAGNPAFLTKAALLALGIVNVALQHAGYGWRQLQRGVPPTATVRLLAGLSLLIWLAALIAGRWIGFL